MNIHLLRSYPKLEKGHRKLDSKGIPITVFVYQVTGTKAELEAYEKAQLASEVKTIKDDDGQYLFFTTRPTGEKGTLLISPNGKVFVDTTAIDLAVAMERQYGSVGRAIARDIAGRGFTPVDRDEPIDQDIDPIDGQ